IDLSKLKTHYGCASSTISLKTGAITIAQNSLILKGPAEGIALTGYYDGSYQNDRVITHTGNGTLTLQYLNIEYAKFTVTDAEAKGGCIYSDGNVLLEHSLVLACEAASTNGTAYGGGIFAKGVFVSKYSRIVSNTAKGNTAGGGGGGVYVQGSASVAH